MKQIEPLHIWGDNWLESYLRKSFTLAEKPLSSVLRIFSDTGYELYLNGRFVASVNEWVNNRDYDVSPYLSSGKNLLAIRALNHGGHRGLVVELRCVSSSNVVTTVVSDASWKALSEERWGWRDLDFIDTNWQKAQVLDTSQSGTEQWRDRPGSRPEKVIPCLTGTPFFQGELPKYTDSPFFNRHQPVDAISADIRKLMGKDYRASKNEYPRALISPVHICSSDSGNGTLTGMRSLLGTEPAKVKVRAPKMYEGPELILDFGEEMAGYLRVGVTSKDGIRLRILYGETLAECHNNPPRDALVRRMVTEDIFISPGQQEWESRTRQGFRFVKIEIAECSAGATIAAVQVRSSTYPVRYAGYFSCSDPLLNRIWSAGRRTLHLCMQEYYLDAIKRDRFLWVGDLRLEALINYYLFGDLDLLRCSCAAFADAQYNDGAIPSVLGEGAPVLWDYVAWWLVTFDDYYQFSGDKLFLQKHKDAIIKAANWLAGKAGRDGLVNVPKNTTRNWMCILSNAVGKDPAFNALYYRALTATATVLNVAGDAKTGAKFKAQAEKLAGSFRKLHGIHPNEYVTDLGLPATGALDSYEKCESYFKSRHTIDGLNNIRENWAGMLEYGSDTFWESVFVKPAGTITDKQTWKTYDYTSHCHGWTGGPNCILPAYVAGIRPLTPGFRTFSFAPQMGDLSHVHCVVPTPQGGIATRIQRKKKVIEVDLYVPKGSKALVMLPCGASELKLEFSGRKMEGKIRQIINECNGRCSFEVGTPGHYRFMWSESTSCPSSA